MNVSTRVLVGHPFHAKSNAELRAVRTRSLDRLIECRRSDAPAALAEEGTLMGQLMDISTILAARSHYREAA